MHAVGAGSTACVEERSCVVNEAIIAEYQARRSSKVDRSVLCHAPFTSVNFDQHGRARVCCYNWRAVLGRWPDMSLEEIWNGAEATALRRSFIEGTESKGCDLCFEQLRARNFNGARMHHFDQLSLVPAYRPELKPHAPRVIELELSNTCNLECVQCQAPWSSLIRKNRDHLPPMVIPYDDTFVDQLEPFLPSLVQARFLGGEPMLIHLYHRIWERIRAVNPGIVLSITTNGTVIPDRAFAALADLRSHICLSIDSLDPDNFARIRKNASLDVVLANFERWRRYTRERDTVLSLAVCPMTYNWRDLPAFLAFADRHEVPVSFNTVVRPWGASLANLRLEELDEVIAYLLAHSPEANSAHADAWSSVISQLCSWRDTRRTLDRRLDGLVVRVRDAARSYATLLDTRDGDDPTELVGEAVLRLAAMAWLGPNQADRDLVGQLWQMTPVNAVKGEQPTQQAVVVRAALLLRNLGLLRTPVPAGASTIDSGRLAVELAHAEGAVTALGTTVDWDTMWDCLAHCDEFPTNWDVLAGWLNRLIEEGQRGLTPSVSTPVVWHDEKTGRPRPVGR